MVLSKTTTKKIMRHEFDLKSVRWFTRCSKRESHNKLLVEIANMVTWERLTRSREHIDRRLAARSAPAPLRIIEGLHLCSPVGWATKL